MTEMYSPYDEIGVEELQEILPDLTATQFARMLGMGEQALREKLKGGKRTKAWWPSGPRRRVRIPWPRVFTIMEDQGLKFKHPYLLYEEVEPVVLRPVDSEYPNEIRLFSEVGGKKVWRFRVHQRPADKGKPQYGQTVWPFDTKEEALECSPECMAEYLDNQEENRRLASITDEEQVYYEDKTEEETSGLEEMLDGYATLIEQEEAADDDYRAAAVVAQISIAQSLTKIANKLTSQEVSELAS